ncbi:21 kDa protein-like protein, partial [Corchorus capsularis]
RRQIPNTLLPIPGHIRLFNPTEPTVVGSDRPVRQTSHSGRPRFAAKMKKFKGLKKRKYEAIKDCIEEMGKLGFLSLGP